MESDLSSMIWPADNAHDPYVYDTLTLLSQENGEKEKKAAIFQAITNAAQKAATQGFPFTASNATLLSNYQAPSVNICPLVVCPSTTPNIATKKRCSSSGFKAEVLKKTKSHNAKTKAESGTKISPYQQHIKQISMQEERMKVLQDILENSQDQIKKLEQRVHSQQTKNAIALNARIKQYEVWNQHCGTKLNTTCFSFATKEKKEAMLVSAMSEYLNSLKKKVVLQRTKIPGVNFEPSPKPEPKEYKAQVIQGVDLQPVDNTQVTKAISMLSTVVKIRPESKDVDAKLEAMCQDIQRNQDNKHTEHEREMKALEVSMQSKINGLYKEHSEVKNLLCEKEKCLSETQLKVNALYKEHSEFKRETLAQSKIPPTLSQSVPFVTCRTVLAIPIQRASCFAYLQMVSPSVENVLKACGTSVPLQGSIEELAMKIYCVVESYSHDNPQQEISKQQLHVVSFPVVFASDPKLAKHLLLGPLKASGNCYFYNAYSAKHS